MTDAITVIDDFYKLNYEKSFSSDIETVCEATATYGYGGCVLNEILSVDFLPKYGRMKKPIIVNFYYEDNYIWASNTQFEIHTCGDTQEEALNEFADYFIEDYKSLKSFSESQLDENAKKMIKEYEQYICDAK